MRNHVNNTPLFRACYGLFEVMSLLTERNGHDVRKVRGFSFKDEVSIYKEGFNLIYGSGEEEHVDIVGAPFGIYDMPNFAITKRLNSDGTKSNVFMFFD